MKKGSAVITCGLAEAAAVSAIVSAAVGGYSAYASGQSQEKAAEYNADMADLQALDSLQRGADEAAAKKERARKIAAKQMTAFGASGIESSSGTPLALLTETAGLGELDALTTLNNAKREAWGYRSQGNMDRFQGKAAGRAGILNAGGTLLGGASNAYFGYKGAK